jgi:protein tyrosine/serine phosphatase
MSQAREVMRHLKERGVSTIISLEDPADGRKDGKAARSVAVEKAAAASVGIAFRSHPMRNDDIRAMDPQELLSWLQAVAKDIERSVGRGGVLFHCAAGHDRTGLVAAYLRITEQGWTVAAAIGEMRRYGHNWPKYSSNGGVSSWHEDFLKRQFQKPARP